MQFWHNVSCYPLLTAFPKAAPLILEPIMAVEVNIPQEFQVSCFSILLMFLSAFRYFLPLLLPLNERVGHAWVTLSMRATFTSRAQLPEK